MYTLYTCLSVLLLVPCCVYCNINVKITMCISIKRKRIASYWTFQTFSSKLLLLKSPKTTWLKNQYVLSWPIMPILHCKKSGQDHYSSSFSFEKRSTNSRKCSYFFLFGRTIYYHISFEEKNLDQTTNGLPVKKRDILGRNIPKILSRHAQ